MNEYPEPFDPRLSTSSPLRTSPEIDKIAAALAKAQAAMQPLKKNKTAQVPLKTGGSYSYNYSDLADLLDTIREPFATNGLAMIQVPYVDRSSPEVTCIGVVTRVMHESGQWFEGSLAMPVQDAKPQSIGSVITYIRRYMAGPMAGVSAEEDEDGNLAQGHEATTKGRERKAQTYDKSSKQAEPVTVYDGETPILKADLFALAKKHHITQIGDLKRLNNACKGMDMTNLEAAVLEWKQENLR